MPITSIALDQLHAHPLNRTVRTDCPEFAALTQNIKLRLDSRKPPLINLPVVRALDSGGWQIICGHRRIAALKALGVAQQRCQVKPLSDQQAAGLLLLDNLHRQDLSGAETLQSVLDLQAQGLSSKAIAQAFGKSKQWVSNIRALAGLSAKDLQRAKDQRMTLGAMTRMLARPAHQAVASCQPADVQVVRKWKVVTKGPNKLLQLEIRCGALTVAQILGALGLR